MFGWFSKKSTASTSVEHPYVKPWEPPAPALGTESFGEGEEFDTGEKYSVQVWRNSVLIIALEVDSPADLALQMVLLGRGEFFPREINQVYEIDIARTA